MHRLLTNMKFIDPTADSEKYSSWIELTGFSLLFSFGQNLDPEKFFFPFYDLPALFFPSIPCRFLFFRASGRFPIFLPNQAFILPVPKRQFCDLSEIFPWPDLKSFFHWILKKCFSNCQRLCSLWMRFEGFRAINLILVTTIGNFPSAFPISFCAGNKPSVEGIPVLLQEVLQTFSNRFGGRHIFLDTSFLQRSLVSIPFRNRPQIKLMFLCSNDLSFRNASFDREVKFGCSFCSIEVRRVGYFLVVPLL